MSSTRAKKVGAPPSLGGLLIQFAHSPGLRQESAEAALTAGGCELAGIVGTTVHLLRMVVSGYNATMVG